jgi:hypothetical protein
MADAGSPLAVKGVFLWQLLTERREAVTVRIRGGRITIYDDVAGAELACAPTANPSSFTNLGDVREFMDLLKDEGGYLRNKPVRQVPVSASPPRTYALMTFTDVTADEVRVRIKYDVARPKWRLRKLLWELGNRLFWKSMRSVP